MQWDYKTATYKDLYHDKSQKLDSVVLSRAPIKQGLTNSVISEKTPKKAWWNLTHYKLDFGIENECIEGSNTITYTVL